MATHWAGPKRVPLDADASGDSCASWASSGSDTEALETDELAELRGSAEHCRRLGRASLVLGLLSASVLVAALGRGASRLGPRRQSSSDTAELGKHALRAGSEESDDWMEEIVQEATFSMKDIWLWKPGSRAAGGKPLSPEGCGYVFRDWTFYTDSHDDHKVTDSWEDCCQACYDSKSCHLWTWFFDNATAGIGRMCSLKQLTFPVASTDSKAQCPRVLRTPGAVSGTPGNFQEKGASVLHCLGSGAPATTTSTVATIPTTTQATITTITTTSSNRTLVGGGVPPLLPTPPWWLWPLILAAGLLACCLFIWVVMCCWPTAEPESEPVDPPLRPPPPLWTPAPPPQPPPMDMDAFAKGYMDGMMNTKGYIDGMMSYVPEAPPQAPPLATVEISGVDSVGDGIPDVLRQDRLAAANLQITPSAPTTPAVGATGAAPGTFYRLGSPSALRAGGNGSFSPGYPQARSLW